MNHNFFKDIKFKKERIKILGRNIFFITPIFNMEKNKNQTIGVRSSKLQMFFKMEIEMKLIFFTRVL